MLIYFLFFKFTPPRQQKGMTAEQLRRVDVHIIDKINCSEAYEGMYRGSICAGEPGGGYDACQVGINDIEN